MPCQMSCCIFLFCHVLLVTVCLAYSTTTTNPIEGMVSANGTRWSRHQQEDGPALLCPKIRSWPAPSKYTLNPLADLFDAVSCMAFSEEQRTAEGHPIAWVASAGYQTAIHAVDFLAGTVLASIELTNINQLENPDWQSMSLGPCSSSIIPSTCIYIGNLGNTQAHDCVDQSCESGRQVVELYKLKEPNIKELLLRQSEVQEALTIRAQVATMLLNYSHPSFGLSRNDAQTLFVDWHGDTAGGVPGDVYIVTKNPNSSKGSTIAKIAVEKHQHLLPGDIISIRLIAVGNPHRNIMPVDGAMSSSARLIALRTLDYIYFYPRSLSQTVVESLEQPPCDFVGITPQGLPDENTFQTVTFVGYPIFVVETSQCYTPSTSPCDAVSYVYQLLFPGMYDEYDIPSANADWVEITRDQFTNGTWESSNFVAGGENVDFDDSGLTVDLSQLGKAVRIRGNNGVASCFLSNGSADLSTYAQAMVQFYYYAADVDELEGFFIELSEDGGVRWYVAQDWAKGIDFTNTTMTNEIGFIEAKFVVPRINELTLSNQMMIRFRANIKDLSRAIYIADIRISASMTLG